MKRLLHGVIGGLSVFTVLTGGVNPPAFAEVYKYQDAQGRWQYTDRPRPGVQPPGDVLPTPAVPSGSTRDLNAALRSRFSLQTPVQEATLSTVTLQTPLGTGSGFFISRVGHVLTNKCSGLQSKWAGTAISANSGPDYLQLSVPPGPDYLPLRLHSAAQDCNHPGGDPIICH